MDFIFKSENEDLFWKEWRTYLAKNPSSFRYLPTYLEYATKYAHGLLADRSFVYLRGGGVVGICPLFLEDVQGRKMLSFGGGFTAAPLASDEKAEKVIFEKIDQIARGTQVAAIKMFLDPQLGEHYGHFNQLRKYGYLDISSSNMLADLTQPEEFLWQGLRKSYKPLINGTLKKPEFQIEFFDSGNPNYAVHEMYRELHHKCAGKVTRPKETFDLQYKMLLEGNALLAGLKVQGAWVAFNYFAIQDSKAMYFSTSDDPEYPHARTTLYHALLWSSMKRLKNKGIKSLEMGQPSAFHEVEGFQDYADKKQIDIGMYKRGMSADMVSWPRGVKYFDVSLCAEELENFAMQLKNSVLAQQSFESSN